MLRKAALALLLFALPLAEEGFESENKLCHRKSTHHDAVFAGGLPLAGLAACVLSTLSI
jgi:hypothetical protein